MKLRYSGFSFSWRTALFLILFVFSAAGFARPVTVAVISDLNGSYGSTFYPQLASDVIQRIIAIRPDVVISTGDMVAGQQKPLLPKPQVEAMWASFHKIISDPLASAGIPFAVTPGNHDGADSPDFQMERALFAEQWTSRKPAVKFLDDGHYPFYYAFSVGNAVFISVDATLVGPLPEKQMKWLENLLAKSEVKKSRTVLFSHVPLWPFASGRERDFIGDGRLEKLLQKADADLYLSGHHHAFYPGHKDGIYYVSQACVGAGPRPLIGSKAPSKKGFTLIQIEGEDIRINAFEGANLNRPYDWENLPQSVSSKVATLLRADRIDPAIDDAIRLP
jgi:hypothetical protein